MRIGFPQVLGAAIVVSISVLSVFAQGPELVVQTGHSDTVISVKYSLDGKMIASLGNDKTVKLWDAASRRELRTIFGVSDPISLSPNGRILAGTSGDEIKFWSVVDGSVIRSFGGNPKGITSLSFSPNGKLLASGGVDGTVKLWDVDRGQELFTVNSHPRFEAGTTDEITVGRAHNGFVTGLAFSPDGQTIATAGQDRTIKLWDSSDGSANRILNVSEGSSVYGLVFSPDGLSIAGASGESNFGEQGHSIGIWDVTSGQKAITIPERFFVNSIAFSPDGRTIASGSGQFGLVTYSCDCSTLRLWNAKTGLEIKRFAGSNSPVVSIAFSPDGVTLASGNFYKEVTLWNVASGRPVDKLASRADAVKATLFGPDGNLLVSQSGRRVTIWDGSRGDGAIAIGESIDFTAVALSPNGKTLATNAWTDGTIKLWNTSTGSQITKLTDGLPSDQAINSLAFSPNGRILASGDGPFGDKSHSVRLWDVTSGRSLRVLKGLAAEVNSVVISPDGKMVAGCAIKDIKIWDIVSGQEIRTISATSSGASDPYVHRIAFSPDGRTIAAAMARGGIQLWDVASGNEVITLGHPDVEYADALAFSPDGKTIAGATEGMLKIWDAASGSELHSIRAHSGYLQALAFSNDGRRLVTGGRDAKVKLWDLATFAEVVTLVALGNDDWVAVAPDGRFDGTADGVKQIHFVQGTQPIPLDSLFDKFYSPNLIPRVISNQANQPVTSDLDISKGIKSPPLVRISSPKAGASFSSDVVDIDVAATDQGGGVDEIRLYQNGKLVSDDTRQLVQGGATGTNKTFNVTLVPGTNTFRATAFNKDRTEANPVEIDRIEGGRSHERPLHPGYRIERLQEF
jgi:WD40 repeat protein